MVELTLGLCDILEGSIFLAYIFDSDYVQYEITSQILNHMIPPEQYATPGTLEHKPGYGLDTKVINVLLLRNIDIPRFQTAIGSNNREMESF